MNRWYWFLLLIGFASGCGKEPSVTKSKLKFSNPDSMIVAMDVSSLSMVLRSGTVFKDFNGKEIEIFEFLRAQGINTVRFRTWVGDVNYGQDSILKLANLARSKGFLIWLDLHYSNTWADPGNQQIPVEWSSNNINNLISDVGQYTKNMMQIFEPDFMQLGNEIDGGMLWPLGRISDTANFYSLCREAVKQTRLSNPKTKIIFHISNYKNADWFFSRLKQHGVGYDIGGVSYYPKWHGYNIDSLYQTLERVYYSTGKRMIVAENSYPWTFGWADWTDNVMGWEGDLHPSFPGTAQGQADLVSLLVNRCKGLPFQSGYAYWEGVWVSSDGPESKNGSPWENQACFDFSFKALPVMNSFK